MSASLTPRPGPGPGPEEAPSRGFWPMRDLPTAIWLILALAAALAQGQLPAPRWVLIHLLLLGAVTHAILVWSQYFSFALLRSRSTSVERRRQNLRLILANGGAALVLVGVPGRIWLLVLAGTAALVIAVAWHGASLLRRARSSLPGRFGRTVHYYVASAGLLVVGATLGAIIAHGGAPRGLGLAHALTNVLGWIGLTVAGTIVTLWPTVLRTRVDERAATGAARALPVLAAGVLIAATGAATRLPLLLAAGLALYLVGLVVIGTSLWNAAARKPPRGFAGLSMGAALCWWAGAVAALLIGAASASIATATGGDPDEGFASVSRLIRAVVPFLAAGFAAQIVLGALSYLVPVVLGGGPGPVKAGTAVFDQFGVLRAATANAALVACTLPLPEPLLLVARVIALAALASFLPVMMLAMRAQRAAKAVDRPGRTA